MRRGHRRWPALAAGLALLITACGAGAEQDAGSSEVPAAATGDTGPSGAVIPPPFAAPESDSSSEGPDQGPDADRPTRAPVDDGEPISPTPGAVVHVDDGDSIIVDIDGSEFRVRLIGINTPERNECLGADARAALTQLIDGRTILLEPDVEDRDQFGRLLRYVWLENTLINAEMARLGLAISRPFEPNTARQAQLDDAEASAAAAELGIWSTTACGGDVTGELTIVSVSENPAGRDEDDLNGEFVVIANAGDPVDLGGYVLRDSSSVHRFEFPAGFILDSDAEVTVFVGCGADTSSELYWCAGGPVWDNSGDEAFLIGPTGAFAATYSYR